LMFYTKEKRDASAILKSQVESTKDKFGVLTQMKDLVPNLRDVFNDRKNLNNFGKILHEGWMLKKSITDDISNSNINTYYEKALEAGAIGGKLLGAGGGGFLLFYAEQVNHPRIRAALHNLHEMKFRFDEGGSRITYYDQLEY